MLLCRINKSCQDCDQDVLLGVLVFVYVCVGLKCLYSRTSVARTLMARLPRLFRTRSRVPRKTPLAADLG